MVTLKNLAEKIESLETEKTRLMEEVKKLRKEAEGKVIALECEVAVLREEAESLRKMIKISSNLRVFTFLLPQFLDG